MSNPNNLSLKSFAMRHVSEKVYRILVGILFAFGISAASAYLMNLAGLITYGWVAAISAAMLCYLAVLATAAIVQEFGRADKQKASNQARSSLNRLLYGVFFGLAGTWLCLWALHKVNVVPEFWSVVAAVVMLLYALCVACALFGRGLGLAVNWTQRNA